MCVECTSPEVPLTDSHQPVPNILLSFPSPQGQCGEYPHRVSEPLKLISLISLGPQHLQSLGTEAYDPPAVSSRSGALGSRVSAWPGSVPVVSVSLCRAVSSLCPSIRACLCICPALSGLRVSQQVCICDSERQLLPSAHRLLRKAVWLCESVCLCACDCVCVWLPSWPHQRDFWVSHCFR